MTRRERRPRWRWRSGPPSLGAADPPPVDSAILFARPSATWWRRHWRHWIAVRTLAITGIHLSDVGPLNHQRHLFQERQVLPGDVEHRADARDFRFAGRHYLAVTTQPHSLADADRAHSRPGGGPDLGGRCFSPSQIARDHASAVVCGQAPYRSHRGAPPRRRAATWAGDTHPGAYAPSAVEALQDLIIRPNRR